MNHEVEIEAVRQKLASAVEARDATLARVTSSGAALARANALVAEIDSDIQQDDEQLKKLDAVKAADLAAQLRLGAAAKMSMTRPRVDADVRAALQNRLTVVTTARDELQHESDAHAVALAQNEGVVREHALALIRLEAERIAISVEQREVELFDLRMKLKGVELAAYSLAVTVNDTTQRPNLLTQRAVGAMVRPLEPQSAAGHDPAKVCAVEWKKFYDALTKGGVRAALL